MYIVFEGVVGTGKTTQSKRLHTYLKKKYAREILLTREPGGSQIAERIRKIVQGTEFDEEMTPLCEAYLYAASRAQVLPTQVRPVLKEGGIVIADRSFISSLAYQGEARGLGIETVLSINEQALIMPDLIIYLDLDPAEGLKRTFDEEGDKFEKKDVEFFKKIEKGYKTIASMPRFADRWIFIDAKGTKNDVFGRITENIGPFLQRL